MVPLDEFLMRQRCTEPCSIEEAYACYSLNLGVQYICKLRGPEEEIPVNQGSQLFNNSRMGSYTLKALAEGERLVESALEISLSKFEPIRVIADGNLEVKFGFKLSRRSPARTGSRYRQG